MLFMISQIYLNNLNKNIFKVLEKLISYQHPQTPSLIDLILILLEFILLHNFFQLVLITLTKENHEN
tara:strand:+ start:818 stop:1018 length:201 start_codon:yes stop_codon:yes gene_type:complete